MQARNSSQKPYNDTLDKAAALLSFICAIHCFLLPILIVVLPVAIAENFAAESSHTTLVTASMVLALISVAIGHKRHKNYNLFFLPIAAAFLFIFSGHHDARWNHAFLMSAAGAILVATHIINRKLCKQCDACVEQHSH